MEHELSLPSNGPQPTESTMTEVSAGFFQPTIAMDSPIVKDSDFFLSLAVIWFTLSAITTVGNSVLLLTIFRDPRRLLQTPPSLLITNLCVSDLMVGLVAGNLVAVKDVYRYQHLPVPDNLDPVVRLVLGLTLLVSSGTIIALSYDRYIVVMYPFKYKCTVTKTRVKIFIAVMWTVSLAVCFVPVTKIPPKLLEIVFAHTHASLPIVLLTVMYIKVFRAFRERKRELREAGITWEMRSKKVLNRERKMVVTILIVLALFYVTFLPEFIALHLKHFSPTCARSLVFKKMEMIFSRFLFLNSAMNPFVYAWRLPKYRKAVWSCFASLRFRYSKCLRTKEKDNSSSGVIISGAAPPVGQVGPFDSSKWRRVDMNIAATSFDHI